VKEGVSKAEAEAVAKKLGDAGRRSKSSKEFGNRGRHKDSRILLAKVKAFVLQYLGVFMTYSLTERKRIRKSFAKRAIVQKVPS